MNYYFGAYYFLKLNEANFGSIKGSRIFTCSNCINNSFLDDWSLSWSVNGRKINNNILNEFNLNKSKIKELQSWSDQKFEEKKIGWLNTFSDLDTLKEYKNLFFREFYNYEILSINFLESDFNEVYQLLKPENSEYGCVGLFNNISKKQIENQESEFLGYDLIGIEKGGDFHTFHCHDLSSELVKKFGVDINEFGLIKENNKHKEMVSFMNDEKNGFEPVPWFYIKVKRGKK